MKTGLLERFVKGKTNTLAENIIICAATALAGTFYFYEYAYGEKVRMFACLAITVLTALIWVICSVKSGRDGKIGFLIFAFLYWSVPYIYILWYGSRDNLRDYNKWLSMSNRIAGAMLNNPFSEAAEKLKTSPVTLAAVLLIIVMIAYVAGFLLKMRYESKLVALSEARDDDEEDEIDDQDEDEVLKDLE